MVKRTFTAAQRERLLELLADGKLLTEIEREPDMPTARTIQYWVQADDDYADQLRAAREAGAEIQAERLVEEMRTCQDSRMARNILDAQRWRLGYLSRTFAHKPYVGAIVNVDAEAAFGAIREALDRAATGISSRGDRTQPVVIEGTSRPGDSGGGLADMAALGGPGFRKDEDGR